MTPIKLRFRSVSIVTDEGQHVLTSFSVREFLLLIGSLQGYVPILLY